MVCPMKVTASHKHSTSDIVIPSRKVCYAINARAKMHKQMSMALNNTLLTHGKRNTAKNLHFTEEKPKKKHSTVLIIQTQCRQMT